MFEASVNKQFKARFQGMQGVVNMGPLSVLKRLFNGHKIDGYVLSNNIDAELVVMKKEEFEKLCKYIKVEIERTSNIPRAKIVKEKGYKLVEFDQFNKMPYKSVTCSQYSNYLNTCYRNRVINYQHMFFNGLNFSHYDVIYKAMSSNMGRFINNVYVKNGEKVNNILRKRELNAEEYQVALTGVAYIGNNQLNPIYLEKLCAADGSGAIAMRNKLQKYLEMTAKDMNKEVKTDNENKVEKPKKDILNWYYDYLLKSRSSFADLREENGPSPIVYITLNSGVNLCIYRNSENSKHTVIIQSIDFGDKVKNSNIDFNLSSNVSQLEKDLRNQVNLMNNAVKVQKSILNARYDIYSEDWYNKLFRDNSYCFNIGKTNSNGWVSFTYLYKGNSYKLHLNNSIDNSNFGLSDESIENIILQSREDYVGLNNQDFTRKFKNDLQEVIKYSNEMKERKIQESKVDVNYLREELENKHLFLTGELNVLEKTEEGLLKETNKLGQKYDYLYDRLRLMEEDEDWLSAALSDDLDVTRIQNIKDDSYYAIAFSLTKDFEYSDDSKYVYLLLVLTDSLTKDYPIITISDLLGSERETFKLNGGNRGSVFWAIDRFLETFPVNQATEKEVKEMYSWYIPFSVNHDTLNEIDEKKSNLENVLSQNDVKVKNIKFELEYINKLLMSDIGQKAVEIQNYLKSGMWRSSGLKMSNRPNSKEQTPKLKENVNIEEILKDVGDLFDFN